MTRLLLLLVVPLALPGCIARTAANVVTLPVRAVGQTADWMTTSQDEADRNRGREIRKQEKREARERRRAEKQATRRPH